MLEQLLLLLFYLTWLTFFVLGCRTCVAARDPYCGWDSLRGLCTPPPEGNPHADHWEQDVSACPDLNYPGKGLHLHWTTLKTC